MFTFIMNRKNQFNFEIHILENSREIILIVTGKKNTYNQFLAFFSGSNEKNKMKEQLVLVSIMER